MSKDGKISLDSAFSDILRGRNALLLALFWGVGFLMLLLYGTLSGRLQGGDVNVAASRRIEVGNETGSFSVWRQPAGDDSDASYRVVFDNLSTANQALGIFRTASQKRIQIDNLHVAFMVEGPSGVQEKADRSVKLRNFCDLFAPPTGPRSRSGQLGVFEAVGAGGADWSVGVDLSNATEVRIKNLDWRVCTGPVTRLRVRSGHAWLRTDATRVMLRGHVTVTTPQAVLEANCIEMDVESECFVVAGRYRLTRGECGQRGERGRFDAALRNLSTASGENEAWANGLQHGSF